jgi:hypothetical protein
MKNTLPGFTADASLYRTKRQFTAALGATGRPVRVVPQYSICDKASYYCNRGLQKWCDILDKFCLPDL